MAHDPGTRDELRRAYVHERLSLELAAERVGVPIGTARRWKREDAQAADDWDKARAVSRISREGQQAVVFSVLEDYMALHQETLSQLKTDASIAPLDRAKALAGLTDALVKMSAALERVTPQLSKLSVANDVLSRVVLAVNARRPDAASALLEVIEQVSGDIAADYKS